MSKLVFKGQPNTVYDAVIQVIGPHQISIIFSSNMPDDETVVSGFNLVNEHNGYPQGDYTDYNYIYRKFTNETANEIQLSSDGSEYVEIPIVNPDAPPVVMPTLAEVIAAKKADFAVSCRTSIENGVTIFIDGVSEKFSYSLDGGDQANIDDIFNMMMQTGLGQFYHCDGGSCKIYTPRQIFELYAAQKMNKTKHVTFYNQLCQILVNKYSKMEDVIENRNAVARLQYGVPEEMLYDEYLETYEAMLDQAQNSLDALRARFNQIVDDPT